MAKPNHPWWTTKDSIWGGDTFECFNSTDDDPSPHVVIGVKKGDVFRIEKHGSAIRLIPHPANTGDWKQNHDKNSPVKLKTVSTNGDASLKRAFSMVVKRNNSDNTYYLFERSNGELEITHHAPGTGGFDGTASIRR